MTLISPSSKSNSDQRSAGSGTDSSEVGQNAWVVALDETGSRTSRELADKVTAWQRHGRPLAFVIGGADGLINLLAQADSALSLSKQTLPHALVRVFLAEALYRLGAASGASLSPGLR